MEYENRNFTHKNACALYSEIYFAFRWSLAFSAKPLLRRPHGLSWAAQKGTPSLLRGPGPPGARAGALVAAALGGVAAQSWLRTARSGAGQDRRLLPACAASPTEASYRPARIRPPAQASRRHGLRRRPPAHLQVIRAPAGGLRRDLDFVGRHVPDSLRKGGCRESRGGFCREVGVTRTREKQAPRVFREGPMPWKCPEQPLSAGSSVSGEPARPERASTCPRERNAGAEEPVQRAAAASRW